MQYNDEFSLKQLIHELNTFSPTQLYELFTRHDFDAEESDLLQKVAREHPEYLMQLISYIYTLEKHQQSEIFQYKNKDGDDLFAHISAYSSLHFDHFLRYNQTLQLNLLLEEFLATLASTKSYHAILTGDRAKSAYFNAMYQRIYEHGILSKREVRQILAATIEMSADVRGVFTETYSLRKIAALFSTDKYKPLKLCFNPCWILRFTINCEDLREELQSVSKFQQLTNQKFGKSLSV